VDRGQTALDTQGQGRRVILAEGETDIGLLTTVLGAIDLAHRVGLLSDGVGSGADGMRDQTVRLLRGRVSVQHKICMTERFLSSVTPSMSPLVLIWVPRRFDGCG
jgi:nicotinamidase-related amidase